MAANQRFVYFAYVGLTALLAAVLAHGAAWVMGNLNLVDGAPLGVADLSTSRLVGLGLAVGCAVGISRVQKSRRWVGEVADELLRVSWPSRDETAHGTLVVIVCVVVSAMFLGLFDATWLWLSSSVMGMTSPEGG